MMMDELLLVITGGASALLSGFAAWFFSRKKQAVEVLANQIDNDVKLSNHYKEILDDLKSRYETRYKEFSEMMDRKIRLLEEELVLKYRNIRLLQKENAALKRENKQLRLSGTNS